MPRDIMIDQGVRIGNHRTDPGLQPRGELHFKRGESSQPGSTSRKHHEQTEVIVHGKSERLPSRIFRPSNFELREIANAREVSESMPNGQIEGSSWRKTTVYISLSNGELAQVGIRRG